MARPWEPDPSDVKALIPSRVNGGAFTSATVPSAADVETLISQSAAAVELEVGDVPASLYSAAWRVTAVRTAQQIERSFFPEQQGGPSSEAVLLWQDFTREIGLLRQRISESHDMDGTGQLASMRTPVPYSPYGFLIVGPDTLV